MSPEEIALTGVILLVALAAIGGIVLLVHLLRTRCPACRKPTLELDLRGSASGTLEGQPLVQMLRCQTCGAEYRRDDKGPMIPKAAWDAGARDELPRATLKR